MLPTVLLHDHLDGGVRPSTVLALAEEQGLEAGLPATDADSLAGWFDQSQAGSLASYLEAFEQTLAVMQQPGALERIAYEAVLDLSADGVAYAEIRFCPALHLEGGMGPDQVVDAVSSGMAAGAAATGLEWGLIIDALRHHDPATGMEMARVAVRNRHRGVRGFDLAGPEAGHPPEQHLAAFRHARESGLRLTIHAGEGAGDRGVAHIAAAMDVCGAERIGHGLELVDDCRLDDGEVVELGAVARRVRDRGLALEMCISSNMATKGIAPDEHPIGALHRAGFNVTISTDNRLMSNTTMSAELELARRHHGLGVDDLAMITRRSLEAAFCDHEAKARLWEDVIAPAYAEAGATLEARWR